LVERLGFDALEQRLTPARYWRTVGFGGGRERDVLLVVANGGGGGRLVFKFLETPLASSEDRGHLRDRGAELNWTKGKLGEEGGGGRGRLGGGEGGIEMIEIGGEEVVEEGFVERAVKDAVFAALKMKVVGELDADL
jgi:hypothetical protein